MQNFKRGYADLLIRYHHMDFLQSQQIDVRLRDTTQLSSWPSVESYLQSLSPTVCFHLSFCLPDQQAGVSPTCSICQHLCWFAYVSVCPSICLHVSLLAVYLPACWSIHSPSVYVFLSVSTCLSVNTFIFKHESITIVQKAIYCPTKQLHLHLSVYLFSWL